MDKRRQRNHKVLLTIAALSSALCACEGLKVLVGTARESVHLNVCMGADTDCEPELDTEPLIMPEPRSCEAALGPELTPDFVIDFSELMCADQPNACMGTPRDLAAAADGTTWVIFFAEDTGDGSSATSLVRISAEGELLGVIDAMHGMIAPPDHSVRQETAMAMDERGHVFVLIYEMDAGPNADSPLVERSWLTEYDADGEIANGPRLITGIGAPKLSIAADGTLVIGANGEQNARYGVLAAFDTEGELLWSQNGVRTNGQGIGYGVTGLATTAYGSFVMAERSRRSGGNVLEYGLMRYDADGNAIWDRMLEPLYMSATLVGTGDHLLFVVTTQDFVGNTPTSHWMGRIDENGEVDWLYDLPNHVVGGVAIDVERNVALTGGIGRPGESGLMEISLDGERCARHALPEGVLIGILATDGAGGVHLMSDVSLARVRLPEE